jgi:hypothetical protein
MKPETWQVQEAIENGMRRPEYRAAFDMSLGEFLKYMSLMWIDQLVKDISVPYKPRPRRRV